MEKVTGILAYVGLAVLLAGLGYVAGRHSKVVSAENAHTTTDTLWVEVHDTCWRETAVNFLRTDTVRLAVANVHENAISGTYRDTLFIHDSVFVEVPIVSHTFAGDHWRVTAHGYRVGLDEVWFDRQVINTVSTSTKYVSKRWNFNVGAQIGYGYTIHGASPYAGIGVAFGYTF